MRSAEPVVSEFLLTVDDMADLLCLSTREIWRREAAGLIPAAVRLGRKTVRWKGTDVEAFMQQLGRNPTTEPGKE